ncbi:hypothetical protein RHGRI_036645 [Rhododendron griersonianum]|uniref:Signal peptidase complex subunit 2 n=1 Tax=Rhododendron griersonianum TaxID=479676 RepID=A0AAV6HP82_9ERIC|nr:hypothetical protein RHGRI_036645 [Rhododendron griersonianum]
MQEKKGGDMATTKSPKKTNLLDHSSIKHILDESVTEIVKNRGFIEDVRLSNVRLFVGSIIIAIALVAQFYRKKFPENRNFLIGYMNLFEKWFIHVCFQGSFTTTGLVVSSKLPRFSDMYTLTIASADPKSVSAKPPVEFTKSVTQWFTKEGVLVEGLFWKDVGGLIKDYDKEAKKSK